MSAATDIGGRHHVEQFGIVARALAQVTVEVDDHGMTHSKSQAPGSGVNRHSPVMAGMMTAVSAGTSTQPRTAPPCATSARIRPSPPMVTGSRWTYNSK